MTALSMNGLSWPLCSICHSSGNSQRHLYAELDGGRREYDLQQHVQYDIYTHRRQPTNEHPLPDRESQCEATDSASLHITAVINFRPPQQDPGTRRNSNL